MAAREPQRVKAEDLDPDELVRIMLVDGVVIITGVLSPDECDAAMDELVGAFEELCRLDRARPETWNAARCLPQTRAGLYQAVVGNLPTVWRLRRDPRIACVFAALYARLRPGLEEPADLVVSGDGLNLRPNGVGPYSSADWPHLDQTRGGIWRCFQGQAVLTETTACLRASLGSHLFHPAILEATGGRAAGDWRKFSPEQAAVARGLVEAAGGAWQVPVLAPKGSLILWASSVIHSARYQLAPEPPGGADPFRGWRGVVYLSYRPREDLTAAGLKTRVAALERNRVTNHWSTRLFPLNPAGRYGPPSRNFDCGGGQNYITSPHLVYALPRWGAPDLRPGRERRLAGYDEPLAPGDATPDELLGLAPLRRAGP